MATKEFTLADVAAHNSSTDIYVIIRDEVYDLSKFAAEVRKLKISTSKPDSLTSFFFLSHISASR